jgi:hypothetical protein
MKRVITAVLLASTLLAAGAASARPWHRHYHHHRHPVGHLIRRLTH